MSEINLLKHQYNFVNDETFEIGLVAGYGSGKSYALAAKAIWLAQLNQGFTGLIISPTYGLIKDALLPTLQELIEDLGITYSYNKSFYTFTLFFQNNKPTKIILRSAEKPKRLIAINAAWALVDEIDVLSMEQATEIWNKATARIRTGTFNQIGCCSSPEGFKWFYHHFQKELEENPELNVSRKLIRAKTSDNKFLPSSYIENLKKLYPEQLLEAYLNGQFVNLTAGTVFYAFDRKKHHTDLTIDKVPKEVSLQVGMDFNVGKMSATIGVMNNGKLYVLDELTDIFDTPEMILMLRETFPGRNFIIYPDASGDSRKSVNASITDITLLRQARMNVKADAKNPFIKDRVNSTNMCFINENVFINTIKCKNLSQALEQLAYGKNSLPDKQSGFDHISDAFSYKINKLFPIIKKPSIRSS